MSKQTDLINIPDVITVSGAVVTESASAGTVEHTINNETSSGNRYSMLTFKDQGTNKYYQYQNHNDGNILFRNEHATGSLQFMTGGANERLRIDSSGNVGIGTSSPANYSNYTTLNLGQGGTGSILQLDGSTSGHYHLVQNNNGGMIISADQGNAVGSTTINFLTDGSERMRLDASGNLLVGKTSGPNYNAVGIDLASTGNIQATRSGGEALVLNRQTNDGDIVHFRKDGTLVGSIGRVGSGFYIAGVYQSDFGVVFDGSGLLPSNDDGALRDNSDNLGHPSYRWEDAFITNGATTGSDANDKQDIATLTNTEMLVAARLSQTFRTYRWKDAVVSKGDSARTHTGTIAQEVQSAFTAEGLNAGDYAMFMSDTWWEHDVDVPAVEAVDEVTDEDGNVTTEAVEAKDAYTRTDTYDTEAEAPEGATSKTRMGIRYPELLSFVAAYNEQRFASIEARLTALEA